MIIDAIRPIHSPWKYAAGIIALIGAFTLFYWLNLTLLMVALYVLIALVIVSKAMSRLWLRPIRVEREVSQSVVEIGQPVAVIIKITNTAKYPLLWLYVEETLPKRMTIFGQTKRLIFLPAGRSFYLNYQFTPTRRGFHPLGPLVLETGDVFGLFKRAMPDSRRDFVTALPAYELIEEFQAGQRRGLADLKSERSLFEDPTRIRGLRGYRRGDEMKRIHWKSSARRGELLSKIYDPVIESGATIVLDFHAETWKQAVTFEDQRNPPEMALEFACTIARYLTDGGWKTGLLSNGHDPLGLPGISMMQIEESESLSEALNQAGKKWNDNRLEPLLIAARSGPEHFNLLRENLGRLELSNGLRLDAALLESLPHIDRWQVLVVLTCDGSDALINAMIRTRSLGYRIMVFVVCNNAAYDRCETMLLPHQIDVFRTDETWRMKEIATGRRVF